MKAYIWYSVVVVVFTSNINAATLYTYVGSFQVDEGPVWTEQPPAYSGRMAAALIFGGSPTDYVISTDRDIVDYLAWYTTWGGACDGEDPCGTKYSHDYLVSSSGKYAWTGDVSAFAKDWAVGVKFTNYVFSSAPVPEANNTVMAALALAVLVHMRRRREGPRESARRKPNDL